MLFFVLLIGIELVTESRAQLFGADIVCHFQQTMQDPSVFIGCVGRCKSASAADVQFCSPWRLRNCRHERVPVTSCSENTASKWSQNLTTRLSLGNDANETLCRWHRNNMEARPGNLPTCCMPSSHITASAVHAECHCVACCSCSPCDRRSGNCPAFTFPVRMPSIRRVLSLDSGLALCQSCSRRLSAAKDSVGANLADLVPSSVECDPVIHKSNSVPACCSSQMRYYSAGISFDSLNNDTGHQPRNFDVDSTSSTCSPVDSDAQSTSVGTESVVSPDENAMPPAAMLSVDYVHLNDQVSPVQYRKRFEVCSYATLFLKCTFIGL